MSNLAAVYVKVNANDKKMVDAILDNLGLTQSALIQMLYKQVIAQRGIPFDVRLPSKPIATGNMSEKEIKELIQEGIDSCAYGTYTPEEIDEFFKEKHNIKR